MQTIEDMLCREDPAFTHHWTMKNMSVPRGSSGIVSSPFKQYPDGCRKPDDFIETIDLPVSFFNSEQNLEMGSMVYSAGMQDVNGFSVTFYEYHDWRVLEWLNDWKARMYNPDTGFYGYAEGYWAEWTCGLLDLSRTSVLYDARLVNVFPTQTNPIQLTGEGGRLMLSQEFGVTEVFFTRAGASRGGN